MINIAERVLVPHRPEIVWGVLSDPATVVSCIDGSELGDEHEDGTFDARLAVKFAALKVSFAARVRLDLQEEERVGTIEAQGADSRGSTRVQGATTFTVVPVPSGCEVVIDGQVDITGQLAGLITTGATVVVDRMTRQFAAELTATCALRDPATPAPAPVPAVAGGPLHRFWQRVRQAWTARHAARARRRVRGADV